MEPISDLTLIGWLWSIEALPLAVCISVSNVVVSLTVLRESVLLFTVCRLFAACTLVVSVAVVVGVCLC